MNENHAPPPTFDGSKQYGGCHRFGHAINDEALSLVKRLVLEEVRVAGMPQDMIDTIVWVVQQPQPNDPDPVMWWGSIAWKTTSKERS